MRGARRAPVSGAPAGATCRTARRSRPPDRVTVVAVEADVTCDAGAADEVVVTGRVARNVCTTSRCQPVTVSLCTPVKPASRRRRPKAAHPVEAVHAAPQVAVEGGVTGGGPADNIVGYYGLLQAFADALKLLLKEYVSPTQANLVLFFLGPIITLIFSLLGFSVVPYGPGMAISDFNLGILYMLAVSSLSTYGILLAG